MQINWRYKVNLCVKTALVNCCAKLQRVSSKWAIRTHKQ